MHLSDGSEMKSIIWMLDPHCGAMFYGIHRISAHLNTHGKFWALWANFLLFFLRVCCGLLLLAVILINRKYITCSELSVRSLGQSAPDTQKNSPLLANRQLFSGLYRNWYVLLTGIPEPRWWWQMLTRKNFYTETCVLKSFVQMFFSPGK